MIIKDGYVVQFHRTAAIKTCRLELAPVGVVVGYDDFSCLCILCNCVLRASSSPFIARQNGHRWDGREQWLFYFLKTFEGNVIMIVISWHGSYGKFHYALLDGNCVLWLRRFYRISKHKDGFVKKQSV